MRCIISVFHQGLCDGSGTQRFIMDVIGVYIYFVNQANCMVITCINSYCCTRINHTLSSLELVCLSYLHFLYSVENLNTGSLALLV